MIKHVLLLVFITTSLIYGHKSPYHSVKVTPIPMFNAPNTVLNQPIQYPPSQNIILETKMIEISPGVTPALHYHPGPLYVYVINGELQVDYGSKGIKLFKEGASFVEAINVCHAVSVVSKTPVQLFTVFIGDSTTDITTPRPCDALN